MRRPACLIFLSALLATPGCSEATKPSADGSARSQAEGDPKAPGIGPAGSDAPRAYESPDGLFRVGFPGDPMVGERPASSKAGTVGEETYTLLRLPRSFLVECTHLAEPRDPQEQLQRLIAESQGTGTGIKVLETKDVTIKGRPGKETLCAVEDERLCRERYLVDGKDLYRVTAIVPDSDEDRRAAAAFVESFELLKD